MSTLDTPAITNPQAQSKWEKLAQTWVDTGPPASPSSGDIASFKTLLQQALGQRTSGRLLVMGSTPSIRDMLAAEFPRFDVLCVDFSQGMFDRMSSACIRSHPRETFLLGDWCRFRADRVEFDAALGDKCIDNVLPDAWDELFGNLHHHLRPGGAFIVHLALADERFRSVTPRGSLRKWADLLQAGTVTLSDAAAGLWEELLTGSAFKGGYHNTVTTSRFETEVTGLARTRQRLRSTERAVLDEFVRVFWPSRTDVWSSYQYEEILHAMAPYFFHERTLYSADYDAAGAQPIVLLRARAERLHLGPTGSAKHT